MPNMTELTIPEMWHKIHYHHKFANSKLGISLLIDPVMVNPETKRIEDDRSTNTELNYWIEFLVAQPITEAHRIHYGARTYEAQYHDYELDCGGVTYEEAIRKAYQNFINKYGETTDEEYVVEMKKGYPKHFYSNLECYYDEELYGYEPVNKDTEFLNNEENFKKSLKTIIGRFGISQTMAVYESRFYFIYKNGIIDSSFDADCVVNYSKETYNIKKNSHLNGKEFYSALKITLRMFNIKYAEVMYDVKLNEYIIFNVEKHDETTI